MPKPVGRISSLFTALLISALLPMFVPGPATAGEATRHGIAMHGAPALAPGFTHFPYANPDAPKGGSLTLGALGTFDSLNPLIVKGVSAEGIRDYVFESLMARNFDEPFSLYGLIAKTVRTAEDRSWVEFTLRPEARFSDGWPVTIDDVVFSHALLRDRGRPNHRFYYSKVTRIERPAPDTVRFVFSGDGDREMPLIIGLMPILPKHATDPEKFEKTGFDLPVGSGPYVVDSVDPGAGITYRRDPDYWGSGLAANRGRFNFDTIRYEYFRDASTLFEAFKKGIVRVLPDDDPLRWNTGYDFPAVTRGDVIKDSFSYGVPAGMSALVLNTRRHLFADARVRKALILLFDFEWINRNLYFGAYRRMQSYFDPSELASTGRAASALERELLAPWRASIPEDLMDGSFRLPKGDGTGRNRDNRRKTLELMQAAGHRLEGGKLIDKDTGRQFTFEIVTATRDQERLALAYARSLSRAGILVRVRQVDSTQYQQRRQTFDFDAIFYRWYASLSPGNEQSIFWGSDAAGEDGSRNYAGIRNPAVDAMIAKLLDAGTREEFVAAVRALDRLLLAGNYVIPLFYLPRQWVARWRGIERPGDTSLFGYLIDTWWSQPPGERTR